MLLACGDASWAGTVLAWVVILGAVLLWMAGAALIVRAARDSREKLLLIALLVVSILLGPALIAAYYSGLFGDDESTGKLALLLLVPGAIGAVIALATRAGQGLRAFLVSTWGAVFLGGLAMIAFFAAVVFGGACIR